MQFSANKFSLNFHPHLILNICEILTCHIIYIYIVYNAYYVPVESHHPVVRVLLVLCGKQDAVALPHRVEEELPSFQIYKGGVQQKGSREGKLSWKS